MTEERDENDMRLAYIRHLFAQEDAVLQDVKAAIAAREPDPIQIYPEEGRLLQLLIKLGKYAKGVEIGTFGAYSTIWIARALPQDGHVFTVESDPARADMASVNIAHAGLQDRITLLQGKAPDALAAVTGEGPFDFVFIDADKSAYLPCLEWAIENVRSGGMIVADNTFLFGAVCHDEPVARVRPTTRENMRLFNERLADTALFDSVMLPTREGLTIAVKK